ncbi:MAG TPA: DUF3106 domain-containing protein [Terriglobales bacterium]
MRAPYTILIALAMAGSTLPASGSAFWRKHNPPPVPANSMPQAGDQVPFDLLAQARPMNPGPAPQTPAANPQLRLSGPGPHKGDWLRKYFGLPPAQQEQTLEKDPSFRALPPDAQKHLLDRLRSFNSLAPDKQQKILNRMEIYEHLPPEKQAEANSLYQRYHSLPSDQRSQVSQAFREMRDMPPEQRTQYMNSDDFRNRFNDEQRELLRGMTDLSASSAH